MSAADLFAGEITLATGETVPLPPELLDAIQDACPEPINDDPMLAAGRTAFAGRFVAGLFARDLLLVPRGRPDRSKETVGIDVYALVCSQKHALQHTLALVGAQIAPGNGRGELHADFNGVVNALIDGTPTWRIWHLRTVDMRLRQLRCLALDIDPGAPALPTIDPLQNRIAEDVVERLGRDRAPAPPPDRDHSRGGDPLLTPLQWWGLTLFTLAVGAVLAWRFA